MSSPLPSIHRALARVIPELTVTAYKGQAGKLGVCGGSQKYAGAPYFAAMSALRLGVDLSTIFCTMEAATPIKSFSPDLMVQGTFWESSTATHMSRDKAISLGVGHVSEWIPKLHVLIMGPGLGTDSIVLGTIARIITAARDAHLPIVLDGDAIRVVCEHPDLIKGYTQAILTPNAMEFKRLWEATRPSSDTPPMSLPHEETEKLISSAKDGIGGELDVNSCLAKHTVELAKCLGGVTIVRKGIIDVISNGTKAIYCSQPSSNRRVGGQGDVLAGTIGTFTAWTKIGLEKSNSSQSHKQEQKHDDPSDTASSLGIDLSPTLLSCFGGCLITRSASYHAFQQHHRGMLASHVVESVPHVLEQLFPDSIPHIPAKI